MRSPLRSVRLDTASGRRAIDQLDATLLRGVAERRTPALNTPARAGPTVWSYAADGVCVTLRLVAAVVDDAEALASIDSALAFQPRGDLVRQVERDSDLTLCGAVAAHCVGGTP